MTKLRWALVAAGILILTAIIGLAILVYIVGDPDADNAPHLSHYSAEEQTRDAQHVVDGLNTHDAAKVDVIHGLGKTDPRDIAATREQDATIAKALPDSGCQYTLKTVDDEGEQGTKIVPGSGKAARVYLLNLNLEQNCPGQPPQPRVLGLYLVPYWGYWTALSFVS
ncbi:hypothetical protein [Mycobacteroides abscessus]|uniref:hypothetical protein n=1 Tax=Mycobacteroides abscessus TaxID=36809 RepID=UPI0019D14F20|nr:hypothetical protein [Mycobacteroides abscessus]MBN7314928.1 hypothetical protein [Mycobacteroides abscessus subsp. abscessus]